MLNVVSKLHATEAELVCELLWLNISAFTVINAHARFIDAAPLRWNLLFLFQLLQKTIFIFFQIVACLCRRLKPFFQVNEFTGRDLFTNDNFTCACDAVNVELGFFRLFFFCAEFVFQVFDGFGPRFECLPKVISFSHRPHGLCRVEVFSLVHADHGFMNFPSLRLCEKRVSKFAVEFNLLFIFVQIAPVLHALEQLVFQKILFVKDVRRHLAE